MNPLLKFRQWIAEPLLARLREEHVLETTRLQGEAVPFGGAHGELRGQLMLLADLNRIVDERRAFEVTAQDIERAKKGMVH